MTFGELLIVFSKKVNLLYFNLMILSCCLLHVRRKMCMLKPILWTLILMTRLSLYLLSLLELVWNYITPKLIDFSKTYGLVFFRRCFWRRMKLNFRTYYLNCWIYVLRNLGSQIAGNSNLLSLYVKMVGIGLRLKTTAQLAFFLF